MSSISRREEVLIEAMDNIPAAFVVYDKNDRLIVCNATFREFYAYSEAEAAPGVTHQELGLIDQQRGVKVAGEPAEDYMKSRLSYRGTFGEEQIVELPDGRLISTRERPIASGGFVSIQIDVTEINRTQATLEHYATTDELTGLTNRRVGLQLLGKMMAQHKRSGDELSICFADIDELKSVNDRFGHIKGDWMIKTIGNALKSATRDGDIVIRLGGDEFLVIFPDCSGAQANARIETIRTRLTEIEKKKKTPFELNFSYGIATYQEGLFNSVDAFISYADSLMYRNKSDLTTIA